MIQWLQHQWHQWEIDWAWLLTPGHIGGFVAGLIATLFALWLVRRITRAFARLRARFADSSQETITVERARKKTPKKRQPPKPSRAKTIPDGVEVVVTRVVDGDTIDVTRERGRPKHFRVRVLGLDTPEKRRGAKVTKDAKRAKSSVTQQLQLGEDASTRAESLLLDETVTLWSGNPKRGPKKDVYDRFLAYVHLEDGRDYGLLMIKEGHAECFGWKYPHPRRAQYEAAQQKAPNRLRRLKRRRWIPWL